jgi:D-glycero-D-manno-heptose 1,7-bisphosphate phosphatase
VFLDRDGTLIRTHVVDGVPRPVQSAAQVEMLPGVTVAAKRLREAGFKLVLVTNQPDVARGTLERQAVEEIHAHLRRELRLDEVMCCFHDDADGCRCRKPQAGMLLDAAERLDIRLQTSFMVGDRWRDVEAGRRAGCTTILLREPYSGDSVRADFEVADLVEAAEIILRCQKERT